MFLGPRRVVEDKLKSISISPSSTCIGAVVIIGRDLFLALFAQAPIICPAKISTIFISIRDQNQLYGIYLMNVNCYVTQILCKMNKPQHVCYATHTYMKHVLLKRGTYGAWSRRR